MSLPSVTEPVTPPRLPRVYTTPPRLPRREPGCGPSHPKRALIEHVHEPTDMPLPDDILAHIASYLPEENLPELRLSSRRFYIATRDAIAPLPLPLVRMLGHIPSPSEIPKLDVKLGVGGESVAEDLKRYLAEQRRRIELHDVVKTIENDLSRYYRRWSYIRENKETFAEAKEALGEWDHPMKGVVIHHLDQLIDATDATAKGRGDIMIELLRSLKPFSKDRPFTASPFLRGVVTWNMRRYQFVAAAYEYERGEIPVEDLTEERFTEKKICVLTSPFESVSFFPCSSQTGEKPLAQIGKILKGRPSDEDDRIQDILLAIQNLSKEKELLDIEWPQNQLGNTLVTYAKLSFPKK